MASSAASTSTAPADRPPATLLSILQRFNEHDTLKPIEYHNLHRLAPKDGAPSMETLHAIVQTTQQLTKSLEAINTSAPDSIARLDAKTIALLKQHLVEADTLFTASQADKNYAKSLRSRNADAYGEPIPLTELLIPNWCIEQVENWAKAAGLECFKDPHPSGEYDLIQMVLGGQVLVVDIEFHLYSAQENPRVELASLKTTHATSSDPSSFTSTKGRSSIHHTPDLLLFTSLKDYLEECQKPAPQQDGMRARKLGSNFREHLQHLVQIDKLVASLKDGDPLKADGSSWFDQVGLLGEILEDHARREAGVMQSAHGAEQIPLDTFLLRSHAIPLPHLNSPSLSFLLYISPLAYLTVKQALNTSTLSADKDPHPFNLNVDVPIHFVRSYLTSFNTPSTGIHLARLILEERTALLASPPSAPTPTTTRPQSLPSLPPLSLLQLPKVPDNNPGLIWTLNFGSGILMSQSRMKEIQDIVGLAPSNNSMRSLAYGTRGSWVEMLVGPVAQAGVQRYTTSVISPSNRFPPLHVTLQLPSEPGYLLGHVPVRSLQETLAVLEIAKEQLFLNTNISMFSWAEEQKIWHEAAFMNGLGLGGADQNPEELMKEISSLLDTSRRPERLLISASIQQSLVDNVLVPCVKLTVPTKTFGTSNVEVTYNHAALRPFKILVDGSEREELEEVVRRVGVFVLGGYVWEKSV